MTTQPPADASQTATERVLMLLAAYEAGSLSRPDAEAAMALSIYLGKVVSSRLADITVSTIANLPPLGLAPGPSHLDRLTEAVSTVLEEPEDAGVRLATITDAEVHVSEQKTTTAAIREHGFPQWREEVAADACEMCQPFAGRIHPSEEAFESHHPRCRCKAVPVGEPVSRTREAVA